MIRVLVVEDSPTVRAFLVHVLAADPEIQVIATAEDGEEAVQAVLHKKPDAVTMDIHMPRMDGLEATRRIMQVQPTPIIIVSANVPAQETGASFDALRAGALAIVRRPSGLGPGQDQIVAQELLQTVKLMAEVKVVKRWRTATPPPSPAKTATPSLRKPDLQLSLVVIGGSTGAPGAVQTILSQLPRNFPLPILIVQHIATGFIQGFIQWLNATSALPVAVAQEHQPITPGTVWVAPDDSHLGIANGKVVLNKGRPEHGMRPSVDFLFRSISVSYGRKAVAVLLSGMGEDGAEGMQLLQREGAITIAQDRESSVVHGMPGEAIRRGAVSMVLTPSAIALVLSQLACT